MMALGVVLGTALAAAAAWPAIGQSLAEERRTLSAMAVDGDVSAEEFREAVRSSAAAALPLQATLLSFPSCSGRPTTTGWPRTSASGKANALRRANLFALAMYVSALAAECMLRAHHHRDRPFDERHDVARLFQACDLDHLGDSARRHREDRFRPFTPFGRTRIGSRTRRWSSRIFIASASIRTCRGAQIHSKRNASSCSMPVRKS
jgi:hypothetical protein